MVNWVYTILRSTMKRTLQGETLKNTDKSKRDSKKCLSTPTEKQKKRREKEQT